MEANDMEVHLECHQCKYSKITIAIAKADTFFINCPNCDDNQLRVVKCFEMKVDYELKPKNE